MLLRGTFRDENASSDDHDGRDGRGDRGDRGDRGASSLNLQLVSLSIDRIKWGKTRSYRHDVRGHDVCVHVLKMVKKTSWDNYA